MATRSARRACPSTSAGGRLVVFSTLPGETHGLGLQMAALIVAFAGCRILYQGTETPPDLVRSP